MSDKKLRFFDIMSYSLLAPGLVLLTAGALFQAGLQSPAEMLGKLFSIPVFNFLFSPAVVVGGAFAALIWNAWQVLNFSCSREYDRWYFAFSVRCWPFHLIPIGLAGATLTLLIACAFAENFQVVAR